MSQIMKTFLGVFLIMFMVVTSSGVRNRAVIITVLKLIDDLRM